jgi:N-acyl-L-homoserine lactone synthetase
MLTQCFAIRHAIYCLKLKWETQAQDEQDVWSHHVLVQEDGIPVATTRVTPLRLFPTVAKLGRTAMLDMCSDRSGARLALVDGVKRICKQYGIVRCLALMEPSMVRLERRYGFVWEEVEEVEHRGRRRFCYMDMPG